MIQAQGHFYDSMILRNRGLSNGRSYTQKNISVHLPLHCIELGNFPPDGLQILPAPIVLVSDIRMTPFPKVSDRCLTLPNQICPLVCTLDFNFARNGL